MISIPRLGMTSADSSWPSVWWEHSVDVEARPLMVLNEIGGDGQDADYLRRLIVDEILVWSAEIRCPATAFSHTTFSSESEMEIDVVKFDHMTINRDRFLFCGLVAAEEFELDTNGTLPLYDSSIRVKRGTWLSAQQPVYELGYPIHSLLVWKTNEDLAHGQLSVKPVGPLRYEALVKRDLYEEIVGHRRPDIWVAALIAALSDLHEQAIKSEEEAEEDEEAQPSEELAYFKRHDIPRGDLFNAAEAATKIAPFRITPQHISDEEDD